MRVSKIISVFHNIHRAVGQRSGDKVSYVNHIEQDTCDREQETV